MAIPYTYEYRGSGDEKEGKQCKVTEKARVLLSKKSTGSSDRQYGFAQQAD